MLNLISLLLFFDDRAFKSNLVVVVYFFFQILLPVYFWKGKKQEHFKETTLSLFHCTGAHTKLDVCALSINL